MSTAREQGRMTPKEYFLSKLYEATKEFEDITGVLVERIIIRRIDTSTSSTNPTSAITRWELELK